MKKRKMRFIWAMVGLLGLSLVSCDKVFDVHPYDVNIKGEKNVNAKHLSFRLYQRLTPVAQ